MGYDTCHCLELAHYCFTAFMHVIYCCVLGGMRVHFNFLGEHVCILYIAYHEYSMIDPSGIIFQVLAAVSLLPLIAWWICDGWGP